MKKAGKILVVCFLILAAAVGGSLLTLHLTVRPNYQVETDPVIRKMTEIEKFLGEYFIDEYDPEALTAAAADGAAAAMVAATGDRWSYYISAEDMEAHEEAFYNEYVGVGIIIQLAEQGVKVVSVTEGGPAEEAGLQVEDVISHIEGQSTLELGVEGAKELVRGEPETNVHFTVLRGEKVMEMDLTRRQIINPVAEAELLEGNIGWITIANFDHHCAEQTIQCMKDMLNGGAKALIFDVRFNPGGLKTEMIEILDAILPKGELFRSKDYAGREEVDYSDSASLMIPMAVLVNKDSYSAAEFFAAAMQEYEAAVIVGEQTVGKGNFQVTMPLTDGSAVAISIGKYYTPQGRSLTDVGVTPDMFVEMEYEDYLNLYYGNLSAEDDTQLQAAVSAMKSKIS